jgi:hypothetical protein
LTLAVLTRRWYVVGQVPLWVLAMLGVLTSPLVSSVKGQVHHCGSIKHWMKVLDKCIYFLIVRRYLVHELIDDEPGCHGVKHLLGLALDLANFFMERP